MADGPRDLTRRKFLESCGAEAWRCAHNTFGEFWTTGKPLGPLVSNKRVDFGDGGMTHLPEILMCSVHGVLTLCLGRFGSDPCIPDPLKGALARYFVRFTTQKNFENVLF